MARERLLLHGDGCWVAPHCLECPRERCVFEVPETEQRYARIRALLRSGLTPDEVVARERCSRRTVWRALEGAR